MAPLPDLVPSRRSRLLALSRSRLWLTAERLERGGAAPAGVALELVVGLPSPSVHRHRERLDGEGDERLQAHMATMASLGLADTEKRLFL
jgi:hypothetical protein